MISIRGGSGLGDALYVQSVARYLVAHGHMVEACCDWPDPFRPLGARVKVSPFRRSSIERLAHYASRRGVAGSTQWEDVCTSAGIPCGSDLRLDWRATGPLAINVRAMAGARPLVLVQLPRAPFARRDGYGAELLPDCSILQRAIDMLSQHCFVVQVGSGSALHRFERLGYDLSNQTSVVDLLDIATLADFFLGYVSYFVPIAESLNKRALLVWSRRGLKSRHEPVRQITPQKVIHRKDLISAIFDDCGDTELEAAVSTLCGQVGSLSAA